MNKPPRNEHEAANEMHISYQNRLSSRRTTSTYPHKNKPIRLGRSPILSFLLNLLTVLFMATLIGLPFAIYFFAMKA